MKKVLFLIVAMMVQSASWAQGEWEKVETEADELKGQQARTVYAYRSEGMGSFIVWDWNEYQFRLISSEAQFDIDAVSGMLSTSYGVLALVGIYDDDGKMIEKMELWLDKEDNRGNRFVRTRNAGTMSNPVGQKGKVKKIFNALQSGHGYVRIVVPRYDRSDFDVKIYPYQEE
jgi:hypothetical protein